MTRGADIVTVESESAGRNKHEKYRSEYHRFDKRVCLSPPVHCSHPLLV